MAKKVRFRADTSFDFGANRPARKPKRKAKSAKKGKGGRSFGS
jgi:hypothetical protein